MLLLLLLLLLLSLLLLLLLLGILPLLLLLLVLTTYYSSSLAASGSYCFFSCCYCYYLSYCCGCSCSYWSFPRWQFCRSPTWWWIPMGAAWGRGGPRPAVVERHKRLRLCCHLPYLMLVLCFSFFREMSPALFASLPLRGSRVCVCVWDAHPQLRPSWNPRPPSEMRRHAGKIKDTSST